MSKTDVYQIVTDHVIELLNKGIVPWRKPWRAGSSDVPQNLVSKRPYSGINFWLLGYSEFSSPYWLTYRQAQAMGGYVKQGERSSIAVFWKILRTDKKDENGEDKTVPLLRYYRVFNLQQCEGIEAPKPVIMRPFNPIAACESVVAGMPNQPTIQVGGGRAYYRPSTDAVQMPQKGLFSGDAEYYSTLFHELVHSTGHAARLGRKGVMGDIRFGSGDYSKEELIAEMGAAYLCALTGIENSTIENSAAYIGGWLRRLKSEPKMVVLAAAAAQKAADFITGESEDGNHKEAEELQMAA